MIVRILLLLWTKLQSLFLKSLTFSSRIEYSKVSRKARIWGHCKLFHTIVGDYTYIGHRMRVSYAEIGKFCSIAGDGAIGMGTHSMDYISTSPLFSSKKNGTCQIWTDKSSFEEYKKITIGNDVWIGDRVLVMGGVTIGNGAVVGAGAIVTKNVPAYAIVGGVPAKVIRYRFSEDVISCLEESKWWTLDDDILKENIDLFQRPLVENNLDDLMKLCLKSHAS